MASGQVVKIQDDLEYGPSEYPRFSAHHRRKADVFGSRSWIGRTGCTSGII